MDVLDLVPKTAAKASSAEYYCGPSVLVYVKNTHGHGETAAAAPAAVLMLFLELQTTSSSSSSPEYVCVAVNSPEAPPLQ